jgi:ferrous iron transport protein A
MKNLTNQKKGETCRVASIEGDNRFISRISSMGITIGSIVTILQNTFGMPMLLYAHDTLVALSKKEAGKITVEAGGSEQ